MKKTAFDITENKDLKGKVFLITGAYSGLGAATTKALLKARANVIGTGRNAKSQAEFTKELKEDASIPFEEGQLDMSQTMDLRDLSSVRNFTQYVKGKYKQIDCLINNAGVMFTPPGKTKDGFETQFGTNVIGHFLLAKLLADITNRQVWLSSKGHTRLGAPRIDLDQVKEVDDSNYDTTWRYQQAKLGNILLAKQFNLEFPNLVSASVHPGLVQTNLGRSMKLSQKLRFMITNPLMMMSMQNAEQGASTQVMVATMPEKELVKGAYYADCQVSEEAESAKNMDDAKKLFDYCDTVTSSFQS
ncbi:MAG: SDR family NAD(P)-dependent oxidoreductase [Cytophagales bacterium]|nr:SDR family NAD(P)-dependent oxidoreductase [Cytophagales bacterium]